MSANCNTDYLCAWMDYYLCAMNKAIQGPTGPMGPAGPRGPQGVPGPAGSGINDAVNGLNYDATDKLVKLGGTLIENTNISGDDGEGNIYAYSVTQMGTLQLGTSQGSLFTMLGPIGHINMSKPPDGSVTMKALVYDETATDGQPNLKLATIGGLTTLSLRLSTNTQIQSPVSPFFRATLFNVPFPSTAAQAFVGLTTSPDSNYIDVTQTVPAATGTNTYLWINYTLPPDTGSYNGHAVDVIVLVNGEIVYNTTLTTPGATGTLSAGIPPLPIVGLIEVVVVDNSFDTNGPSNEQGVLTVGGKYILSGEYSVNLTLNDSTGPNTDFTSFPNTKYWPAKNLKDENYINFKTSYYGVVAIDGVMTITKSQTYNNLQTVRVTFTASTDATLNFVDTINPGAAYTRSQIFSKAQLDANDFKVTIEPI